MKGGWSRNAPTDDVVLRRFLYLTDKFCDGCLSIFYLAVAVSQFLVYMSFIA